MKKYSVTIGLLMLLAFAVAESHQTYLISDPYVLNIGSENVLMMRTGSYHQGEYSIPRKMLRDVSIVMGGTRVTPPDDDITDIDSNPDDDDTYIKVVPTKEGTGLIGGSTHADLYASTAQEFEDYLKNEGMFDVYEEFKANNEIKAIRERYFKHAKGIFQVGETLSDDYRYKLDYKVEIFLDENPGAITVGDDLSFQVLFEGKPLKNQLVYVGNSSKQGPANASVPEGSVYSLRTDDMGRATFKIDKKDGWYIELTYMRKMTNDADANYESNWSTITFEVD